MDIGFAEPVFGEELMLVQMETANVVGQVDAFDEEAREFVPVYFSSVTPSDIADGALAGKVFFAYC